EALGALGRLGSREAVVAIAPLLDERGSPEVRVAALDALGRIGSDQAIRTLIQSLASEDAAAKSSSVRDALEASAATAVGPLVAALRASKTFEEREQLVRTLGRTGSPRAVPELRALFQVHDLALRVAAIDAMGEIGPAGQESDLVTALGDDSPSVRLHAALALA